MSIKTNIEMFKIATAVIAQNRIFLTDRYSNCFFEYFPNKKNSAENREGKVVLLGQFESESPMGRNLYEYAVLKDDYIIFISGHADSLSFYYLETGHIESVELPLEIKGKIFKFKTAAIVGDDLFLFGNWHNCIWKYNIKNKSFMKIFEVTDIEEMSFRDCCCIDNKIYAVSTKTDSIWIVDCVTNDVSEYKFSDKNLGYVGLVAYENRLFLLPFQSNVFREYDINTNESKIFADDITDKWYIGGGYIKDDKLFVYMRCDKPIMTINIFNYTKEYINVNFDRIEDMTKQQIMTYEKPIINGEQIICYIQATGWILIGESGDLQWKFIEVTEEYEHISHVDIIREGRISEIPLFELRDFLEKVK